jgi:hypothetical protein
MKKLDKKEIVLISYLALIIVRYVIFYFNIGAFEFQKSYAYVVEHSFIIAILLFLRPFVDSVLSNLLVIGIVVFKSELILYNILLLLVSKEGYNALNCSYDVVLLLSVTIGIIIIVCRFFDKIAIFVTKIIHASNVLLKWRKQ